ncbi:MAG: hypothetical protein KJ607_14160, partial [Bacteroidetes bacterium]|nr:hypothetical protein [Bacteroidota bacterium]
ETKNNLDYHVVYSKSQLDSLRYDIENDLETTLYFDKYFEMENNAISDMKEEIALFANIKEDLDFYYRYRMSIYGLRDSLLKSDNHDLTKK